MSSTVFLYRKTAPAVIIVLCVLGAVKMLSAQTNPTQPNTAQTNPTQTPDVKKQGAPAEATSTPAKPAFDNISFKHARSESLTNTLVGNDFVYQRADSVTTGDHARYKEDPKTHKGVLDADGNLVFDDPKHHATCNKAHIDTTIKLAVFTESVVLTLKPEDKLGKGANSPAPPTDGAQAATATTANTASAAQPADGGTASDVRGQQKHGVTVYCDRMEDQYKKKYITLYGHVLFKQKFVDANGKTVERELTAEHAEYNGKSEIMTLFGPVDGHDSNGQEVHSANKVYIGTKEGEDSLEGDGIKMKLLPQEDTEDADATPAPGDNAKPGTDSKATDTTKDTTKDKDGKTSGAKGTR